MFEQLVHKISCPYCGERFDVLIDTSVETQEYVEDCQVCCRPISFSVEVYGDDCVVSVRTENE